MKVLFKTFFLFILGAAADIHKIAFDRAVCRCFIKCGNISSLTRMSDTSYSLYNRFQSLEKDIKREMELKSS